MTLPSTHQSPITVNRKAKVLTIGTVKLNSVDFVSKVIEINQCDTVQDSPAFPINKKNHTLPVKLSSKGTA